MFCVSKNQISMRKGIKIFTIAYGQQLFLTRLILSRLNPWRSAGIPSSPLVRFASNALVRSNDSSFTVNLMMETLDNGKHQEEISKIPPCHSGCVHLLKTGGEAGAVELAVLVEHQGVAVGGVRDVHLDVEKR